MLMHWAATHGNPGVFAGVAVFFCTLVLLTTAWYSGGLRGGFGFICIANSAGKMVICYLRIVPFCHTFAMPSPSINDVARKSIS